GRAGTAEQAGRLLDAVVVPQDAAIFGVESIKLVGDGDGEDAACVYRGGRAHRRAHAALPDDFAAGGIERENFAEAGGDENLAVVDRETAADVAIVIVLGRQIDRPEAGPRLRVSGAYFGGGVHG